MSTLDPSLIAFSNGNIRPFAEHIIASYKYAKNIVEIFSARNYMAQLVAASGEPFPDNSPADGRPGILTDDVVQMYNIANWIVMNSEVPIVSGDIPTTTKAYKVAVNTG
jgi:hypothetical protein